MKVVYSDQIDWEPLLIGLYPATAIPAHAIDDWLEGLATKCNAILDDYFHPEIILLSANSHGFLSLGVEGLTETSLNRFVGLIRDQEIDFDKLLIGYRPEMLLTESHPENTLGYTWINVEQCRIKGRHSMDLLVNPFQISKYPVTVEHFKTFAQETGYVTINERNNIHATYLHNDCLLMLPKSELLRAPAYCVSFDDAKAYCEWSGFRLPSENEWLAAFVLDWEECSDEEYDERIDQLLLLDNALQSPNPEWTAEYDPSSNSSLVRYGPHYLLEPGYTESSYRQWHNTQYSDIRLTFRVCK